jgi:hypothetical protein
MSAQRLGRGQRWMGKVGAAAMIASLAGVPQDLTNWAVGSLGGNTVFAGTKPPVPPPPPPRPGPSAIQPLLEKPDVYWFAAWDENTSPTAPNFFPTPPNTLGVPAVQAIYGATPTNVPLGLKVIEPISDADAISLFYPAYNGRPISYVFSDNETGSAAMQVNNTRRLVNQVRAGGASRNAYVGHFDLTPLSGVSTQQQFGQDPTRRGSLVFTKAHYDAARVNMANTVLYPGQPSFRNTSTGDWANANIRTGLFIGPIGRMTAVQEVLNADYKGDRISVNNPQHNKQIPWVARFNNSFNNSLDTDGDPNNGYRFVPGVPLASNPSLNTSEQMLGRGDFSAQVLHYRMRGAYSVNLFHEGGAQGQVEGYSAAMAKQDVRDGWFNHSWGNSTNQLFMEHHDNSATKNAHAKPATLTLNPVVDGSSSATGMRSEETGVIWSGVYELHLNRMDVLASNLDTASHMINFGEVATEDVFVFKSDDGHTYGDEEASDYDTTLASRNFQIEAGLHKLLQFDKVKTRVYDTLADLEAGNNNFRNRTIWLLNQSYNVFGNNDRNDVGIPEPTTFGLLAAAGSMAVVCRRQRRSSQQA